MKHIILICCIFVVIANRVAAQGAQIKQADFNAKIAVLGRYFSQQNLQGEGTALTELNGMMNSQMSFLNSLIATRLASYVTDTTTAGVDSSKAQAAKAKALADLNAANAELNQNNSAKAMQDVAKANGEVTAARQQEKNAHLEREKAGKELDKITQNQTTLATENEAYNGLQPLIKSLQARKYAGTEPIMNNLKLFASTLQ